MKYVLVADKATGMTYPVTEARAQGNRYQVLPDSPYDRNGRLLAPSATKAAAKAAAGKPKEASK